MMRFHQVHGKNAVVSEDGCEVERFDTFCHGICFTQTPIPVDTRVAISISKNFTNWSGALRLGFTSVDPVTWQWKELPRYAVPDLTNMSGYWAKSISEQHAAVGNQIDFHYDGFGKAHYSVNNESQGLLVPEPIPDSRSLKLWGLVDVYGNTAGVRFVQPTEIPREILARGPEAWTAFRAAMRGGTRPMYRTRLMLVGQERAGKTSLKKSLTGQQFDANEDSTDGIDTAFSCDISVSRCEDWKLTVNDSVVDPSNKSSDNFDEEYEKSLAINIALEILKNRNKLEVASPTVADSDNIGNVPSGEGLTESHGDGRDVVDDSPPFYNSVETADTLRSIPDSIAALVESLLQTADNDAALRVELERQNSTDERRSVELNIWDFAGQSVYYTTHQVFLTYRAVYLLVFDLTKHLDEPAVSVVRTGVDSVTQPGVDRVELANNEMTNIEFLDFWLSNIYAFAAERHDIEGSQRTLSPPVFLVGTHAAGVPGDESQRAVAIESIFARIREYIKGKPYIGHVVHRYYAVENCNRGVDEEKEVERLRKHIEEAVLRESYMGEQMPLQWLKFERSLSEWVKRGINYISVEKLGAMIADQGMIVDREQLETMLNFYHDLGSIVYFGGSGAIDAALGETVIIRPQWLIDVFRKVITVRDVDDQWSSLIGSWDRLDRSGVLDDRLIDHMWREFIEQKVYLVGLMERFDLLVERLPPRRVFDSGRWDVSYVVPSRLRPAPLDEIQRLCAPGPEDVVFFLLFHGFLPDGLFHRLLIRAVRWSQDLGGREPTLYHRRARLYLDDQHDLYLEMAPKALSRIKVVVLRVRSYGTESESDSVEEASPLPQPSDQPAREVVAKVRNFIDSTLADLREIWMKHIMFEAAVRCPCGRPCPSHGVKRCDEEGCFHFLNLDECVSNKLVLCEHTRVKSNSFRRWFPEPRIIPLPLISPTPTDGDTPVWLTAAAKLLSLEPDDWTTLGLRLGYRAMRLDSFRDDDNPGVALLSDWILSSGNQQLSLDMLVSSLDGIGRQDVVDLLQKGRTDTQGRRPPPVFISYQWEVQDEVRVLRDRLESYGFRCWMDIGQMGGGDLLYQKIDEGIRQCRVVIACVTPKYLVSSNCCKEVTLADLLHKLIVPIVLRPVDWPPAGCLSLTFSQYLYVDFCGTGGHGGSGLHADMDRKYNDVAERISRHVQPEAPVRVLNVGGAGGSGDAPQSVDLVLAPIAEPSPPAEHPPVTTAAPTRPPGGEVVPQPLRFPRPSLDSLTHSPPSHNSPVETVDVRKCAICNIL